MTNKTDHPMPKAWTREDDRHMITHPDQWPCWPYLPVKRRRKDARARIAPECCLLQAVREPWTALYAVNMWDLPPTREEFENTKKYSYASVDELLADGWEVD